MSEKKLPSSTATCKKRVKSAKTALAALAHEPNLSCATIRNELEEIAEYLDCLIEDACKKCPEGT